MVVVKEDLKLVGGRGEGWMVRDGWLWPPLKQGRSLHTVMYIELHKKVLLTI